MLLRETMWEIFLSTGNIDAYLAYRAYSDCPGKCQQELLDEAAEPMVDSPFFSNSLLREVKWH